MAISAQFNRPAVHRRGAARVDEAAMEGEAMVQTGRCHTKATPKTSWHHSEAEHSRTCGRCVGELVRRTPLDVARRGLGSMTLVQIWFRYGSVFPFLDGADLAP